MFLFAAALLLLASASASAQSTLDIPVGLRGGAASVSVTIHENPDAHPGAATVLAVHGFTENADTWAPLTEAMFMHRRTRRHVKRVIALDLPGHGNSDRPVVGPEAVHNMHYTDPVGIIEAAFGVPHVFF